MVAEGGRRPSEAASEKRASWPNADSGGTGTGPEWSAMRREGSVKAPQSCCILEKSRKKLVNLARIQQNSCKICEILGKTEKESAIFNENFEIRERCILAIFFFAAPFR